MKRIIFVISVLLFVHYSCSNLSRKASNENPVLNLSELTVDNFSEQMSENIGKEVTISGRVTHVCRHGGQRLFITGEDTSRTIRITTGENIPEFDIALEGNMIAVRGIVKELIIDETYLAEWEAEVADGTPKEQKGHEDGLDEHQKKQAEATGVDPLATIQKLREDIAASGKDHLSDYWIETIEFNIKE
jgi:hypothetical protein